ncbi:unnamed protein product [Rhodiola kirilowii]
MIRLKEKDEGRIGFKELSIFNDALLAKQIWRLMEKPDSLVSRLLRERYYKRSSPIMCQLGNRPSVVWRSLWGAGQKIKHWIQASDGGEDVRWLAESDGRFSTRSAYKALKSTKDQVKANQCGEQADKRRVKLFWQAIWKSNVQPKVRFFAWRLYHDYLPSVDNLVKRGMREIGKCPVCGLRGEKTMHSLLYCCWAQIFWKEMSFNCSFLNYRFHEPGDWLWFCVFGHDALELRMILQGARTIWFNRNIMLFGKNGQSPFIAARYTRQRAWSTHNGELKLTVTDLSEGASWLRPRKGVVKINVDGACESASKKAGVGIICRDELGCICFAEAYPREEVESCLQVELEALVRAMMIAEEEKLSRVIFETDNAQVMNALMKGINLAYHLLEQLRWCKNKLENNLAWNLILVPRGANNSADMLAKKARREKWSWRNRVAIPYCLFSVLNC